MKNKIATVCIALVIGGSAVNAQNKVVNQKNIATMKKYQINISEKDIKGLNERIENTRWVKEVPSSGWGGPALDIATVKELTDYWKDGFDWKKQEAYINSFPQFVAKVEDVNMHFVYQKGSGSKHIPVLLLHGWASNFTEFLNMAELIKKENPDLDVIIPSIPGYAFSDAPQSMSSENVSKYLHRLMTEVLGYEKYYVHGGDYGSFISEKLALAFPQSVKGVHLTDISFYHVYGQNENLNEKENEWMQKINNWSMMDGAYAMMQGTKPKTLSTGLNDAPGALAAWLLQLYFDFGNKEIPIFERFSKDELLVNISLYWHTQSIYSSMRIYSEDQSGYGETALNKVEVPAGFAFNAHDISGLPPKGFPERFFTNIVSRSELTEGGHFSALSHPQQIKNDLVKFVDNVESSK